MLSLTLQNSFSTLSSPSVFSTWCHPSEHQIAYKNPAKKTLKSPLQLCAILPLAPLSETLLLTPLILHLLQPFPQPFGSWLKARSLPLSPAFSRKPLTRILQIRECANSGSYCFHLLEPVIAGAFLISKTLECEKQLFLASVFCFFFYVHCMSGTCFHCHGFSHYCSQLIFTMVVQGQYGDLRCIDEDLGSPFSM